MKRRLICVLLVLCLLSALASTTMVSAATNGHTQQEAVVWAYNQNGVPLEYDGIYEYQCVDLIKFYYEYLGNAYYAQGNANEYAYNTLPSGWTRVYSGFQPGDVAVWKTNYTEYNSNGGIYYYTGSYGHVGIIVTTSGSSFEAINQNFIGTPKCTLNTFSVDALQCAIRPDFTPSVTTMDWVEDVCNPSETDAYISIKAVPSVSGSFGECGVSVMDASGTVIGSKTETADASARTYLNIWYNITEELGITLTPGASYSYQFYTYFNGTRYDSPVRYFTTTHTHAYSGEVTAPSCTEQGYTTYTCSICGDSYVDAYTAALGHDWGAWEVDPAPTCTEAGVNCRACVRCGLLEQESLEPLGHQAGKPTLENYTAPTPTAAGGYDIVVYCTRCGAELSRDHTDLPPTGPVAPIETSDLRIYSSISVGTDMVVTWSARKTDVANYEKFWIEVVKHAPDGDETYLYGAEQDEALNEGSTSWSCDFKHIFAKEMGVEIEARVYAEDANGQIYMSPAKTTNIRDYLGGRLTATNNTVSQRVLAADLLNYGAAAQIFMNYDTGHLVNEELTAEQLAKLDEYETKGLPPVEKTNSNYRPAGASNILFNSVSLDNEVVLSMSVKAPENSNVFIMMKDHNTGGILSILSTTWSGSSYTVDYKGLGADKMRTQYDFVAWINGAETGNIRTWSIEGYVGEIRGSNLPLKIDMANALLTYGDSAAAYIAVQ